jgi:hypothetical protein
LALSFYISSLLAGFSASAFLGHVNDLTSVEAFVDTFTVVFDLTVTLASAY